MGIFLLDLADVDFKLGTRQEFLRCIYIQNWYVSEGGRAHIELDQIKDSLSVHQSLDCVHPIPQPRRRGRPVIHYHLLPPSQSHLPIAIQCHSGFAWSNGICPVATTTCPANYDLNGTVCNCSQHRQCQGSQLGPTNCSCAYPYT